MSILITYTLLFFMGLYAIAILIDLMINRSWKYFIIEASILIIVIIVLYLTTGFPTTIRQPFGGISPVLAIAIMFVCTILGIASRYFFYQKGNFSWRSFLKPMFISPIVLLPLLGSVQGVSSFESIQLISFGILAFQNGFFWNAVLEHTKTQK